MALGDMLDYGQSQAGAAVFPAAGLVATVEAFKNSIQVFCGNARPLVFDP